MEKIITEIYNSKELKAYTIKLCKSKYLAEDIFQEMILYLSQKDPVFIQEVYDKGGLLWYCKNMIRYMSISPTNGTYNTYNPKPIDKKRYLDENIFEYNYDIDEKLLFLETETKGGNEEIDFIHNQILIESNRIGINKFSRASGIAKNTILKSRAYRIKQIREKWITNRST